MRFLLLTGCLVAVVLLLLPDDGREGAEPVEGEPQAALRATPTLIARAGGSARPEPLDATEKEQADGPKDDSGPAVDCDVEEVELPPDPVQRGECAVHIALVNQDTGRPATSFVQLWRLDAPGNKSYGRGDQLQDSAHLGTVGHTFKRLPAGRYRVFVDGQRAKADDPPEFDVGLTPTRHELAVRMPRSFPARVQIFDEQGAPLIHATAQRTTTGESALVEPPWRKGRPLEAEGAFFDELIEYDHDMEAGRPRRLPVSPAAGFELAAVKEPSRSFTLTRTYHFQLEARSSVHVELKFVQEGPHVYQALSVPIGSIHDAVILPDGGRAVDDGARIEASCTATLAEPYKVFDPRDHRVLVKVYMTGYEHRRFWFVPGDPIPRVVLRRRQ